MTGRETVLLVEDDPAGRELGQYNLSAGGYAVDLAADGAEALSRFDAARHHLVVTDLRMPGASGMKVLEHVHATAPDVPVVVITAHGSVEAAVQAMRAGAHDFLEKPFSRDVLLITVERALAHRRLALENAALRRKSAGVEREVVYASAVMAELLATADRVAVSDATVLVSGESGTGKELIARRLHARSPRGEGPFVAVSCAAIPAELLESELFGHERGAFTGADRARQGRFRRAQGGTLFLDEIGELPAPLQVKLLRVLQEKVVDAVGADRPREVDVRVVAATNQPLAEMVAEGRFREDLFYRLNVLQLELPPLRERPEDLEVLARHFVAAAAGHRELHLPEAVLKELSRRPWPGNVRELQNACERLVVLCEGDALRLEDLPQERASQASDEWPPLPPDGLSLVDLERRVIQRALALNQGNVSRTARYLRIPRHVLAYRLEKYGISRG